MSILKEETVSQAKIEPPKKEWSADAIGQYIEKNSKNTAAVLAALKIIVDKPKEDLERQRRSILIAMNSCKDNSDVVLLT